VAAMTDLEQLRRALNIIFDEKPGEPTTPQAEQIRWAEALATCGHFFRKIDPILAGRFYDLSDEFLDQSEGRRPYIFRTQKKQSAKNTRKIEATRARVVFAVDVFIALDDSSPEDAAKKVLHDFPGILKLAGPKSRGSNYKPWRTVLEWRRNLHAASRKKTEPAAELSEVGADLIMHFIKTKQRARLEKRARCRARSAELYALKYRS
jgi:hypothetical protein